MLICVLYENLYQLSCQMSVVGSIPPRVAILCLCPPTLIFVTHTNLASSKAVQIAECTSYRETLCQGLAISLALVLLAVLPVK